MAQISITRAMSELKSLEDRFNKAVGTTSDRRGGDDEIPLPLVAVKHGRNLKPPFASYDQEAFEKLATANFQRMDDLNEQIIRIKVAIYQSNATTMVKLGDTEMTVAEAIIRKQLVELREKKLNALKRAQTRARKSFDEAIAVNQARVEKLLGDSASTSGASGNTAAQELEGQINSIWEVKMVDPNNLVNAIARLEEQIADEKRNIDFVLSESNATTFIEIS